MSSDIRPESSSVDAAAEMRVKYAAAMALLEQVAPIIDALWAGSPIQKPTLELVNDINHAVFAYLSSNEDFS